MGRKEKTRIPTRKEVDALLMQGLSIRQTAVALGCSTDTVNRKKSVDTRCGRTGLIEHSDSALRNPICPQEYEFVKKNCKIGDFVTVRNRRKMDMNSETMSFGQIESSRIIKKLPHIVLLENGVLAWMPLPEPY
ncbi:MAG: hypothetical protein Q4F24_07970 [Eubacteriales bacterium]|nr:hypothetical protein [Eubacteriales bacterium]